MTRTMPLRRPGQTPNPEPDPDDPDQAELARHAAQMADVAMYGIRRHLRDADARARAAAHSADLDARLDDYLTRHPRADDDVLD